MQQQQPAPLFQQMTMPNILCCGCGVSIPGNAANMCVRCIRNSVDITEGIPKQSTVAWCKQCGRYAQPPNAWIEAPLESRELLALCLRRIKGLTKVRLVDASWIWTEPHSRRLKVKLTVQKEVFSATILQQQFVVEFIVQSQQCDKCQQFSADQTWNSQVQVRQKVPHKRTFLWLEQLLLKHEVHQYCTSIKEQSDGLDFHFQNRSQALRLVEFINQSVPTRSQQSKQLISTDTHTGVCSYKFAYSIEIVPACRDDLLCLSASLARSLGNISPLLICARVSSLVHVVDPLTLQIAELPATRYWRESPSVLCSRKQLITYIVLDVSLLGPVRGKFALAEIVVAKESDLGVNDTQYLGRTHLGAFLNAGDHCLGYDLTSANWNDNDVKALRGRELPEFFLVRKTYPYRRAKKKPRVWKLRALAKEKAEQRAAQDDMDAEDYETFLRDLEEDPEMRSQVNLYKAETAAMSATSSDSDVEADFPDIQMQELLEEFDGMQLE